MSNWADVSSNQRVASTAQPVCFRTPSSAGCLSEKDNVLVRQLADLRNTDVGQRERVGLCTTFRLLGCGEESSIHVFARESNRVRDIERLAVSANLLSQVAREEVVHDQFIKTILAALARGTDDEARDKGPARRFFMKLASRDPARHFFRISELDASVCIIMGELLRTRGIISRVEYVQEVLARIRSDEARHVRWSRAHVCALGHDTKEFIDDAEWIRSNLCDLIRADGDQISEVGIDVERVLSRIMSRGLTQGQGDAGL